MNKTNIILVGIILILAILLVFTKAPVNYEDYTRQRKIDSLSAETRKKDSLNNMISKRIFQYSDSINLLRRQLDSNDFKTRIIYEEFKNKASRVDKYTPDDLDSFFSNRYGY